MRTRASAIKAPPQHSLNGVPHYVSVDSTPRGYAVARSPWLAPLFLVVFGLVSGAIITYLEVIQGYYIEILSRMTSVHPTMPSLQGVLGFRPFFLALIVFLGVFAAGSFWQRIKMLLFSTILYLVGILLIDVTLVRLGNVGGPAPFSAIGSIVTGFFGVIVIAVSVFGWYRLPSPVKVNRIYRQSIRYSIALLLSISISVIATLYLVNTYGFHIEQFREFAVLGGLGPGLALFFPLLGVVLFLFGSLERILTAPLRWVRSWKTINERRLLSVAFLVPAYNEAHAIASCIRALDVAASRYPGVCSLYIVNNNSSDDTGQVAEQELHRCKTLVPPLGNVLFCPTPGKSHALNFGLARIQADVVIRVDADTEVAPDVILKTVPHFWNKKVGGVAGLTLPKKGRFSWLSAMRAIEVIYNVGFLRVGQNAVDGIMVLPGIMSAYRRDIIQDLGGFGVGFNGEDTDMAIRIGRLGYRINVDPSIRVYTEVPANLAHLREQRLRWTRSYFHVAARNAGVIKGLQGVRGFWVLPVGVFGICRRLIVLPIIVYALVALALEPAAIFLREGAAIAAVLVGPQIFTLTAVLVLYRRPLLLLVMPTYLIFRLIRTYIALESFMTLPVWSTAPVGSPNARAKGLPALEPVTINPRAYTRTIPHNQSDNSNTKTPLTTLR